MIRKIFRKMYLYWLQLPVIIKKTACHTLPVPEKDTARQLVLPQNPLPALPEGRESVLAKEIDRLEKESNRGCGCYFELYHVRLLHGLRALNNTLTEYDRVIFNRLLSISDLDISDESYEAACLGENEVLAEIRANCE